VKSEDTRGGNEGTMEEWSKVFLLAVVAMGVSGKEQCTTDQHRQMQADFRECSVGFTSKPGLSACEIITKVVDVCGASWNICHGPRAVREMKDEHIGRYEQQYSPENCPIIEEFRSSGRKTGDEVGPLCSDAKTRKVQTEFQQCSHEEATQLYRAGLDMTSGDPNLEQMLCQALKTMLTTCFEPITECFGPEDVEQMRASTEADQKKFLFNILDGKVTEEAANRCGSKGNPPVDPIAPVSVQKIPIPPVSEDKIPVPSIADQSPKQSPKLQDGSAVNSVQEEEKQEKSREPPIGDVMKENEPPIGDVVGAQMGWESLGNKGLGEEETAKAGAPVKEEAADQTPRVVQLVQPSFKSSSPPSSNFFGAFYLLLSLLPLRLV